MVASLNCDGAGALRFLVSLLLSLLPLLCHGERNGLCLLVLLHLVIRECAQKLFVLLLDLRGRRRLREAERLVRLCLELCLAKFFLPAV